MNKKKTILITGATSGIGLATAKLFAAHNYDLVVCGRRVDRLYDLQSSLPDANIEILSFDISLPDEVKLAVEKIKGKKIDILINNAGNAHGLNFFQEGNLSDWEKMIDVNIKGLIYLSKALIPEMIARKSGHIINIGSIAGLEQYPKGNVYSATKHAVVALSEGMRMDLLGTGVKVSCVNPGMVNTEFSEIRFKGDKNRADNVYKGFIPLSADDVANTIFFISTQPSHVNLAEVTILPSDQASATLVNRKE